MAAPVHLNIVLSSSRAVSQRTPSSVRHGPGSSGLMLVLRGPCRTESRHLKPPPAWTACETRSYAPPPLRNTTPVGKTLTVPLRLKPTRGLPCASAVGLSDVAAVLLSLANDAATGAGYDGPERVDV